MLKAYKYQIYPNKKQALAFDKHFGCVRFIFNWALAWQKRYYAMFGKSLSHTQSQSQLVKKKKMAKFTWLNKIRNWIYPSHQAKHDRDVNEASIYASKR